MSDSNPKDRGEGIPHGLVPKQPAVGFFEQFSILPNQDAGVIDHLHIEVHGVAHHTLDALNVAAGPAHVVAVGAGGANIDDAMYAVDIGGQSWHGQWKKAQHPHHFALSVQVIVNPLGTAEGWVWLRSEDPNDTNLLRVSLD